MREDCDSSCPDSEPFDALDRSNTGSAKNTPKSDIAMLTRIQHLASLNWASHLIVDRRLKRPRGRVDRSFFDFGRHAFLLFSFAVCEGHAHTPICVVE